MVAFANSAVAKVSLILLRVLRLATFAYQMLELAGLQYVCKAPVFESRHMHHLSFDPLAAVHTLAFKNCDQSFS